ncbi:MAG: protein kinase [Myxococcales bacterium]|nr:protein kinase [Myxococcales bacterium]
MRICPQCSTPCDETHRFCPTCGCNLGAVKSPEDPLIGRTLPGGYVIFELIGVGGMGRVYRAEQVALSRTVAVKIIHPHLIGEENAAARFITEARAASRLNHPNSVGVIDFGKTEDGQLYLVMEFLRGKDLARVQYDEGPLPFRRVVSILRQVLAALSEAHHIEIIHRDLKPENIILEPTRSGGDFVKVVDFGLAKIRVDSMPGITSPGIVCGTPEYMSPEQGRGDALDARSDLYGVGVILYQLLTGKIPFEAESPTQVVLMHLSQEPQDPRDVAPERKIPDALVDVCLRALAKSPDQRYENADAFSDALARALASLENRNTRAPQGGIVCGTCGAMNAEKQKFCGECGASLQARVALDTPPPAPPVARPSSEGVKALGEEVVKFPLPFMGREEDLAWLADRLADAKSSLVGARVVGEPGLGKSRLLGEFLARGRAEGHVVVETGPDPFWAEVGYFAIRKAIVGLAGLPSDGGSAKDWASAGPEAKRGLADVFATGDLLPGLSHIERRFVIAEALRWAIVRASERAGGKKVVLCVDDLNLVDGASRSALADAVGEPPLVPALLVVSYTPGYDPGWPASTASARVLDGLSPALVARFGGAASGPVSKPTMAQVTRGVAPLYVDQLLRFTREQGGKPPSRLGDIIAARVERLSGDARKVIQAICVYGDECTGEMLVRLVSGGTRVDEALTALESAGMVIEHKGTYRTSHPLLRDVVLATIPAAVRRELHGAAAELGEDIGAPIEARAVHLFFAQNTFEALILLERVSSRAAARGDTPGTITALRRGLELARRELFRGELEDPMRAVLIFARKLGQALTQSGQFTDAEGVLREALDMAGPSGAERARVLGALAQVALGRDRVKEAQRYLGEALELAFASGAKDLLLSLEEMKKSIAAPARP